MATGRKTVPREVESLLATHEKGSSLLETPASDLAADWLKAVVFLDGGLFHNERLPGTDQVDFAPRLKKPVLMMNGLYDYTFLLEKGPVPLFRMLGTPEADKRHIVLEAGHDVTAHRTELTREVLAWFDKYLGKVD